MLSPITEVECVIDERRQWHVDGFGSVKRKFKKKCLWSEK